jgi:hypothetical protein
MMLAYLVIQIISMLQESKQRYYQQWKRGEKNCRSPPYTTHTSTHTQIIDIPPTYLNWWLAAQEEMINAISKVKSEEADTGKQRFTYYVIPY